MTYFDFVHSFLSSGKNLFFLEKSNSLMLWAQKSHVLTILKWGVLQSVILRPASQASPRVYWKNDFTDPTCPTASEFLGMGFGNCVIASAPGDPHIQQSTRTTALHGPSPAGFLTPGRVGYGDRRRPETRQASEADSTTPSTALCPAMVSLGDLNVCYSGKCC